MGKEIKKIIKITNEILDGILEVIYPRENYCIICKAEDCNGICKSCKESIKKSKKHILKDNSDYDECSILSYGYYGGVLKELILKFKYERNFTAGDILAELLEEYIINNIEYSDYVIAYIPLSKNSKRIRGFNQCEYISRKIAKDLSIKMINLLIKVNETKEQKRLNRVERFENIKGAFEINPKIELKKYNIILIDDVTTTGATLQEGYRILKKSGIKRIKLLTLAKSHI